MLNRKVLPIELKTGEHLEIRDHHSGLEIIVSDGASSHSVVLSHHQIQDDGAGDSVSAAVHAMVEALRGGSGEIYATEDEGDATSPPSARSRPAPRQQSRLPPLRHHQ
jgi:hypothetical protein